MTLPKWPRPSTDMSRNEFRETVCGCCCWAPLDVDGRIRFGMSFCMALRRLVDPEVCDESRKNDADRGLFVPGIADGAVGPTDVCVFNAGLVS